MAAARTPVLQICHSYEPPYETVAEVYASLFPPDRFELTTLFLTGVEKAMPARVAAGRCLFWQLDSRDLRGLRMRLIARLRALVRANGPALIVAHRIKAIHLMCAATRGQQGPVLIGVVHAYGVFAGRSRQWLAWRNRDRLHLIGVSSAIRDDVLARTRPWGLTSVHSQPNGLDIESFDADLLTRQAARERLDLHPDTFVVGCAGRLHDDKDFPTLLRAFAVARPALPAGSQLVIMGDGPLDGELRSLAAQLGCDDVVRFTGQVEAGWQLFRAFDAFVLAAAVEPFGMVLIEAMRAGLPVSSSATGGGIEVLGEAPRLFPIGDVEACAEQLRRLGALSPAERRREGAQAAARVAAEFSSVAFRRRFWQLPFLRDAGWARGQP